MKIYVEDDRKRTKIKDKNYVGKVLKSVVDKLTYTRRNINAGDEVVLAEIANCASLLQNISDEMTYEDSGKRKWL